MEKLIIGGVDMWGNMMATQALLDQKICQEKNVAFKDLNTERALATMDELLEYAKETRCFHYWSLKEAAPEAIRLEEFVDGIHFYLSRGNEIGLNPDVFVTCSKDAAALAPKHLKNLGNKKALAYAIRKALLHLSVHFENREDQNTFTASLSYFLMAGYIDGFSDHDIERHYYIKNAENHDRQKRGY